MLLAGVREKSKYLFDALENAPGVQNMTGMGLMIGIKPQREAGEVIEKCRAGGVLVIKAKDKLRLLPPLNIEKRAARAGRARNERSAEMKHLLKLMDLSKGEITEILNLADQLKYEKKNGIEHHLLRGKTLGMIFEKSSTRTRVSFEVGMYDLGGNALFLSSRDLQIGRGEPVEDTARVLSRYLDGIMIRTFAQEEVETLARAGSIPIINGLTDYCHPCQVLADLMTIREKRGSLADKKLCFIGDGNNMANSLIVGGIKMGMSVAVACPQTHQPDAAIMQWASESGNFVCTDDIMRAAAGADVLYTDVWASMGQEAEGACARADFQRLPNQRRRNGGGEIECDGAALPACTPGRGDHRGGFRGARR